MTAWAVRVQASWITISTVLVLVLFLFGFGTYELIVPAGAGEGPARSGSRVARRCGFR